VRIAFMPDPGDERERRAGGRQPRRTAHLLLDEPLRLTAVAAA
jgi:hypothetical protein